MLRRLVDGFIRFLTWLACDIDVEEIDKIPDEGPCIVYMNHVNFLEAPLMISRLTHKKVTGIAKEETWDNPIKAFLFNLWKAIPISRGEADMKALKAALRFLKSGGMLAIAPEGTRSGDGKLAKAQTGISFIAVKSGSPIFPMACYGHEVIWKNVVRLKRTPFRINTGPLFEIKFEGKLTHEIRDQITDEIMFQLAELLPQEYRGAYSDLSKKTTEYINFLE